MEKGLFKFPPLNSGIHYKKTQNLSSNRLMTLKSTTKHATRGIDNNIFAEVGIEYQRQCESAE